MSLGLQHSIRRKRKFHYCFMATKFVYIHAMIHLQDLQNTFTVLVKISFVCTYIHTHTTNKHWLNFIPENSDNPHKITSLITVHSLYICREYMASIDKYQVRNFENSLRTRLLNVRRGKYLFKFIQQVLERVSRATDAFFKGHFARKKS